MIHFLEYFKKKTKFKKNFDKDDDGNTILNISIDDKNEILSPFHYQDKEIINDSFAGLLDNVIKTVPPKEKVCLSIKSNENLSEDEKHIYSTAIKNFYENKLIDTQVRLKKSYFAFTICAISAVIFLTLLFLSMQFNAHFILTEIIDIVAWVFAWEAVDIIVFQCNMIRLEKARSLALFKSKIIFN